MKEKVLAYIIQNKKLLVFTHRDYPDAGIQVPAGTIDPGESPEDAVFREILEESGLKNLSIKEDLGIFEYFHEYKKEWHRRHVFLLHSTETLPEYWSHTVSSGSDDRGLVFNYYWLELEKMHTLAADQGTYFKKTSSDK